MSKELVTPVRTGTIDSGSEDPGKFPFDAWEFDLPSGSSPKLRIKDPWIFDAINRYADTVANLASANAVIPKGWVVFETDTLSFKIGDGVTAYNTLTYFYRGLPVAGEPSLGTPHPHYKELVTNADPAGTGYTSVDCSGEVPVGTKLIYVNLSFNSIGVGDQVLLFTDSTPTPAVSPVQQFIQVSGISVYCSGLIGLSSARTFVYKATNANVNGVYIRMFDYWI